MLFTFTNVLNRYAVRSKPPILQWVAGGRGAAGIIVTSTNGTSWTAASSNAGISQYVYGVAYGNGLWVVVGDGSVIAYSTDRTSWTGVPLADCGGITAGYSVVYGNGRWVIVGQGSKIATSTNGTIWSAITSTEQGGLTVGFGIGFTL